MIEDLTELVGDLETLVKGGVLSLMYLIFVAYAWGRSKAMGAALAAAGVGLLILVVARNPDDLSDRIEEDVVRSAPVVQVVDEPGTPGWGGTS